MTLAPAKPSTSAEFFNLFASMGGPGGWQRRCTAMMMLGVTANDSNGTPINWMIAEGDMVTAVRHRNWPWPGGPEPVYDGTLVDIWKLKDGKITDQRCSCTPSMRRSRGS